MVVSCIIRVTGRAAMVIITITALESLQLAKESVAFPILTSGSPVFGPLIVLVNIFELFFAFLGAPIVS